MKQSKTSLWIFIVFVMTIMYSTGAGFVESFVNYPLWHIIGLSDVWVDYHQALGLRIIFTLVIPALLVSLILNIWLFFSRPDALPRWTVLACLIILLVAFISSVTIQIPIQAQLDRGYDRELVDKLIVSGFWLRDFMAILRLPVIGYMMYRVMTPVAR